MAVRQWLPAGAIVLAAVALGAAAVVTRAPIVPEDRVANRPIQVATDGYVSSRTCRACHPSQYDSWRSSHHRTMTQVATPETVLADFGGAVVDAVHGEPMRLERRGGEFWAEFNDPGADGPVRDRPRITRQVVMITGSHHQQIYWYATGHGRALNVLPGVYLIADRKWVPRSAVVLHPPNQSVATVDGHWNAICLACHTTFPRTRFRAPFLSEAIEDQSADTTAAEFGVACEACHGPAADHVRAHRSPLARYGSRLDDRSDPTIVLPTRLDPQRSSQVCGQCHSVWEFRDAAGERRANADGFPYRPGDELRATRLLPQPMAQRGSPELAAFVARDPAFVTGSFWPDGMIRVSGREYNGLIDSPCYRDADAPERTLSCFSCHAMHQTPDDPRPAAEWAATHQVAAGREGDAACTQCHEPIGAQAAAHTRHRPESAGAACYNCHMPYTSYGLLKAMRSHTVSSPSVAETVAAGRPNACNLCHLDKTLAWTGAALEEWYGTPTPALTDDERTVAASLLWALRGDAGERALAAWAFGWGPAQEASGTTWMPPYLAELLNDPYDAVRYVAHRSLRTLPGYAGFEYDYVAGRRERVAAALPVLESWRDGPLPRRRREPALLVDLDGRWRVDDLRRILRQRDDRPLFLRE